MSTMNRFLEVNPKNYQRAFFFERLGYLLMDYVLEHYKKRDFLVIYSEGMLGTYITNEAAAITLENGKEIFSSKENFETLRRNLLVLGDELKMRSRPQLIELLTTIIYHFADLAAKQHHAAGEDVKFYTFDEVIRLLETGDTVDPETIATRKVSYVLSCRNGSVTVIDEPWKTQIIERFKAPDYASLIEFQGTIASKGKVIAKARVILPELDIPYHEFVKKLHALPMNQGEVLVTETTSPDFVPLMKKAGGIIANQGGLNSHAAIMSRELGIPCLVGTYHATHILTTGDLIDLDANKGRVKILQKAPIN